jgi:ABC-2 type transport system permease protein
VNIFLRELKANFKSLLIWSFVLVLFIAVGFSKFSAYYENPEMLAVLDGMPPAMLAAFSVTAFNLTTVTGFYGVMATYFALILSIAAAMWGSGIISKEERDKTVEFSLTLPVRRTTLITAKIAAALVNCLLLSLVAWGVSMASAQQYAPEPGFGEFVGLASLSFLIIELIFLAVGIFLGCTLKQHKQSGSIAVWAILGTYFLSVLIGMNEDLDFLKYLTPFKYFDPARVFVDLRLEPGFVVLSLALAVLFVAAGYLTYNKRDLYI